MTDRDRLAADLHEVGYCADDVDWPQAADFIYHHAHADRLIALGWTRLDMRRVVRAIHTVAARHGIGRDAPPPLSVLNIYGYSRATPDMDEEVAKAYREDANAD